MLADQRPEQRGGDAARALGSEAAALSSTSSLDQMSAGDLHADRLGKDGRVRMLAYTSRNCGMPLYSACLYGKSPARFPFSQVAR